MDEARTWFVLQHRRGPAVPDGQSVFDHPGIGDHFAFLERRAAAGQLVAAGPMPDAPDTGMTVLDVGSLAEAERLAREDDQAVATGVLDVTVRPWRIVMTRQ
jgi:uncharacterized protein YciI